MDSRTGGWYTVEPSELQPEFIETIGNKLGVNREGLHEAIEEVKCQIIAGMKCRVLVKAGGEHFRMNLIMDPSRQVSIVDE